MFAHRRTLGLFYGPIVIECKGRHKLIICRDGSRRLVMLHSSFWQLEAVKLPADPESCQHPGCNGSSNEACMMLPGQRLAYAYVTRNIHSRIIRMHTWAALNSFPFTNDFQLAEDLVELFFSILETYTTQVMLTLFTVIAATVTAVSASSAEATSRPTQHNLHGESGPGYVTEIHNNTIAALADLEIIQKQCFRNAGGNIGLSRSISVGWSRHLVNTKYNVTFWNASRLEVGVLLGILANIIPALFYTIVHVFSDWELLHRIRQELETHAVETSSEGRTKTLDIVTMRGKCYLLHATFKETLRHHALGFSVRYVREDILLEVK
ncbi:MAG: hypothetical protein Q9213_003985 [Squamulea squamosa]